MKKYTLVGIVLVSLFNYSLVEAKKKTSALSQMFIYKPPAAGAPANRMGGGTRGIAAARRYANVSPLSPKRLAYSASSQPALYWFVSAPMKRDLILTVDDEITGDTLLEVRINGPFRTGIYSYDLSQQGIELLAKIPYVWFVKSNSSNLARITNGFIEWQPLSPHLQRSLNQRNSLDKLAVLSEHGYWYDTLAGVSKAIDNHQLTPESRISLLRQVGLNYVARYEENVNY